MYVRTYIRLKFDSATLKQYWQALHYNKTFIIKARLLNTEWLFIKVSLKGVLRPKNELAITTLAV